LTAPRPSRSVRALVEGARWWAQAFDAAGYIDAFKVEVMPEGADPLDARYNVINWVNRATRSWSYGQSVVDPRTGEIVKGSVLLGSLRIRQDMLIYEGLVGADHTGDGSANDPQRIALSRIRQLAAHEVGHAIGLQHNFSASTQGRASVMDYPVPKIAVTDGEHSRLQRRLWRRDGRLGRLRHRLALFRRRQGGAGGEGRGRGRRGCASPTTPTPAWAATPSPGAVCGTMARIRSPSWTTS
jgi:hypothetical protein